MRHSSGSQALTRALSLEAARICEAAAIAAASLRGRGDEAAADAAAIKAMRAELDKLPAPGRIVIGEGEADVLFTGETVGSGEGEAIDIAADPLEGATLCAKALPNALSVIALADPGSLLKAPDIYMEKIAIGPGFEPGVVDLDFPPAKNLERLAAAKGVAVAELTACILDRPRHARLIAETRAAGAAIRLISDGDIAGVIHCAQPQETGIDIYMGVGGAPEGVLAAAALRCIGGQMQARMHPVSEDQRGAAAAAGLRDLSRKYSVEDMAAADVIFAATGVTGGSLLQEVKFAEDYIETHSLVMRGSTGTVRWLRARHRKSGKSPF